MLVYSEDITKLVNLVNKYEKDKKVLVVCKENKTKYFKNRLSMGNTLEEITHNIFHILREVDKTNFDLVIIEGVKKEGLGIAIMNRLIRACSHNYIEIK